jgi:hypothetical protein
MRHWKYAAAALSLAAIAAWISYNDGLFVARLAGNHDRQAFAYPLLPDGLIVICLLALVEAARAGVPRSRWAQAGLVLGIGMTLAMNAGAGVAHSALDAVIDGLVPVVFFIAVEVVLWHVRHGRPSDHSHYGDRVTSGAVPASAFEAAKARMRQAAQLGFRYSDNQAADDFGLKRAAVTEARRQVAEESPAAVPQPPAAGASGRDGDPPLLPATTDLPAGAGLNGSAGG